MTITLTTLIDRIREKLVPGSLSRADKPGFLLIHEDELKAILRALTKHPRPALNEPLENPRPERYRVIQSYDGVPAGKIVYKSNRPDWPEPTQRAICFRSCGKGAWRHIPIQFLEPWPYDEMDDDDA